MVAADQFGLRLGQVKGQPVGLRKGSDQENQKGERQATSQENSPDPIRETRESQPAVLDLIVDNFPQVQMPRDEKHRNHRGAHGDFIGNDLGGRADSSKERVFRVGGPSGQDNSVNTEGDHRKDEEQPDIQVGDHSTDLKRLHRGGFPAQLRRYPGSNGTKIKPGTERNDSHRDQRRNHGEDGSEVEIELVDRGGDKLLLQEKLRGVRQGLPQAKKTNLRKRDAHPVRSQPILHPGAEPPFCGHTPGNQHQNRYRDGHRLDHGGQQKHDFCSADGNRQHLGTLAFWPNPPRSES